VPGCAHDSSIEQQPCGLSFMARALFGCHLLVAHCIGCIALPLAVAGKLLHLSVSASLFADPGCRCPQGACLHPLLGHLQ
jgi:hypothetical protein